jgi:hypothetical protein
MTRTREKTAGRKKRRPPAEATGGQKVKIAARKRKGARTKRRPMAVNEGGS